MVCVMVWVWVLCGVCDGVGYGYVRTYMYAFMSKYVLVAALQVCV